MSNQLYSILKSPMSRMINDHVNEMDLIGLVVKPESLNMCSDLSVSPHNDIGQSKSTPNFEKRLLTPFETNTLPCFIKTQYHIVYRPGVVEESIIPIIL